MFETISREHFCFAMLVNGKRPSRRRKNIICITLHSSTLSTHIKLYYVELVLVGPTLLLSVPAWVAAGKTAVAAGEVAVAVVVESPPAPAPAPAGIGTAGMIFSTIKLWLVYTQMSPAIFMDFSTISSALRCGWSMRAVAAAVISVQGVRTEE